MGSNSANYDLVQRLRFLGEGEPLRGPLMCRAADEIERLRAEVAEWKRVASAQAELHDTAERELAELRERIEKAPVRDTYVEGEHGREIVWISDDGAMPAEYKGKRVRLLVEE